MLSGIIRNIDDLGRIVLPSEWRKELDLESGKSVEISKEKDTLVLNASGISKNPTYINKKVDSLGRIVLPVEFRKEMGIQRDTPIEMFRTENGICLSVKQEVCCICKEKPKENQITLRLYDKIICSSCKKQIVEN